MFTARYELKFIYKLNETTSLQPQPDSCRLLINSVSSFVLIILVFNAYLLVGSYLCVERFYQK